ncbi:MAG TPA: acetate kinase [Terriglobales bacterium]|nr:acetate kinase [Terriglobales bacterium]
MKILVLNSGSSSQKCSLYEIGERLPEAPPIPLWQGTIEWRGDIEEIEVKNSYGAVERAKVHFSSRIETIRHLLGTLWQGETRVIASAPEIDVVGHRVVHGGSKYEEPVLLTPEVKAEIGKVAGFAPLHNRAELEGMELIEKLLGLVPQVAVFDTGFHRKMPPAAAAYPGPYRWWESGIHRYGFHGINHQYCAARAAQLLGRDLDSLKLVTCHLGNGCSLAAIHQGHSVDTTMGFTPLEGLMMGTRSGSVDPGILTYIMRQNQLRPEQIEEVLNKESGLLGISGISGDMREILASAKGGHPRAKLAFDIYIHRLQAGIGSMVAVLGGIDALVFTAGVGENSAEVRSATCSKLEFLGLKLDETANAQRSADKDIATLDSPARILVIRAQEDWAIAAECWNLGRIESPLRPGIDKLGP